MRGLLFIILGLLLSCQSSKKPSQEEFEARIETIKKSNITTRKLADGWYETMSTENDFKRIDRKTSRQYFINPRPIVLPSNFDVAEEFVNNEGFEGLAVYFDEIGVETWAKATDSNTGTYLIFILDNEIFTTQYVNSQVTNGASAFWKKDMSEAQWVRMKSMVIKK